MSKLFSAEEIETIRELATQSAAVESRLADLDRHELKDILGSAAERYAAGELDLASATLAAAGTAIVNQNQVAAELRHACKVRLREVYAASDDYIRRADESLAEERRNAAAELEKIERDQHVGMAGLPQDTFEPSAALQALRRRHAEQLQYVRRTTPPSKADFSRLLAALE